MLTDTRIYLSLTGIVTWHSEIFAFVSTTLRAIGEGNFAFQRYARTEALEFDVSIGLHLQKVDLEQLPASISYRYGLYHSTSRTSYLLPLQSSTYTIVYNVLAS